MRSVASQFAQLGDSLRVSLETAFQPEREVRGEKVWTKGESEGPAPHVFESNHSVGMTAAECDRCGGLLRDPVHVVLGDERLKGAAPEQRHPFEPTETTSVCFRCDLPLGDPVHAVPDEHLDPDPDVARLTRRVALVELREAEARQARDEAKSEAARLRVELDETAERRDRHAAELRAVADELPPDFRQYRQDGTQDLAAAVRFWEQTTAERLAGKDAQIKELRGQVADSSLSDLTARLNEVIVRQMEVFGDGRGLVRAADVYRRIRGRWSVEHDAEHGLEVFRRAIYALLTLNPMGWKFGRASFDRIVNEGDQYTHAAALAMCAHDVIRHNADHRTRKVAETDDGA